MAKRLPRRKIEQANRFAGNFGRAFRLTKAAEKTGQKVSRAFRLNIGGKTRFMKMGNEQLAAKTLRVYFKEHEAARAEGRINTEGYRLLRSKYLYANPRVGVMEPIGIGLEELKAQLKRRRMAKGKTAGKTPAARFAERYPELDIKRLNRISERLKRNTAQLVKSSGIPRIDLYRADNIRIVGYDKARDEVLIKIIDPIGPSWDIDTLRFFEKREEYT